MVRPKDQRCRSVPKVEFPTLGACGWNIAILATSSLRDEFMTAENEIYISNHLRSPWGRFTPVDLKNDVDDLDAHLTLNHVQNLYTLDIRLATARAGLWLAWCWYLLLLWWWLSRCWAPPCAVPLIRNQKGRVALLVGFHWTVSLSCIYTPDIRLNLGTKQKRHRFSIPPFGTSFRRWL